MSNFRNVPTPWGRSQGGHLFAPGIKFYHTAGHGGLRLTRPFNERIPAPFRNESGWYEEDCEFAIPFYFLHDYIRDYCLAHGLDGYSIGAEEWFGRYDAGHFRGTLEHYFRAACALHFGTEYSDEQLAERHTGRAELERQIAALQRPVETPRPKPGQRIRFDPPIRFTSGATLDTFIYEGGNRFRIPGGYAVRIPGWKRRPHTVP